MVGCAREYNANYFVAQPPSAVIDGASQVRAHVTHKDFERIISSLIQDNRILGFFHALLFFVRLRSQLSEGHVLHSR